MSTLTRDNIRHSRLRQRTAVLLMEWGLSSDKLVVPEAIDRHIHKTTYHIIAKLVGLPFEEITGHKFTDEHAAMLLKLHGPHGYAVCKAMLARIDA